MLFNFLMVDLIKSILVYILNRLHTLVIPRLWVKRWQRTQIYLSTTQSDQDGRFGKKKYIDILPKLIARQLQLRVSSWAHQVCTTIIRCYLYVKMLLSYHHKCKCVLIIVKITKIMFCWG